MATTLVIAGAMGPVVSEGLNQYQFNYRDLLRDKVVTVMLVGLLMKPTALVRLTWRV